MYDQFLIYAKNNYNMKDHCFLNNGNGMWKSNLNGTGRQIWKRYPLPPIYSDPLIFYCVRLQNRANTHRENASPCSLVFNASQVKPSLYIECAPKPKALLNFVFCFSWDPDFDCNDCEFQLYTEHTKKMLH